MSTKTIHLNDWLQQKARSSEKKRQFKEAIDCWDRLLKRMTRASGKEAADVSDLAQIHYRLGMAHRALKDHNKSIYHLKYSIRLDSSVPRYYEAFGKAYLSGGHWRVAKAQFEKAVSLDPKNRVYLRQYAWVLMMMGKKEEARSFSMKALSLKPTDRESQWNLVRIYMECEMYVHAQQLLKIMERSWKRDLDRVEFLLQECRDKLEASFEGAVMKCLRKGMKCDGDPFTLAQLRDAEKLWIDYCLSKFFKRDAQNIPHIWAAALTWFVFYFDTSKKSSFMEEMDFIFSRFGASSVEVWPCIKRLQEAFLIQKSA
jgi:tetratricopeptide (TPR) repeat protein